MGTNSDNPHRDALRTIVASQDRAEAWAMGRATAYDAENDRLDGAERSEGEK